MKTPKKVKTTRTPAKKPPAKKSVVKKSATKKSAAKKTVAKKSVAKKTAAGTRHASSSAKKKTAKKKSVVKKSAAKKKATKKAVAKKKTAKQPAAPAPRRPKSFTTTENARGYGFAEGSPELPLNYGEDRLTLMVKDPDYLFAYWEITPERLAEAAKAKRAGSEYSEAMRLNWEARGLFDANYAILPVSLAARRWYLRVPHTGLPYRLEIGWLSSQGHFISLLDSNVSDSPESWSDTRRRLKAAGIVSRGGVLEYNLEAARPLGASESGFGRASSSAPETPDFGAPGSSFSSGSSFGSGPVKNPKGSKGTEGSRA